MALQHHNLRDFLRQTYVCAPSAAFEAVVRQGLQDILSKPLTRKPTCAATVLGPAKLILLEPTTGSAVGVIEWERIVAYWLSLRKAPLESFMSDLKDATIIDIAGSWIEPIAVVPDNLPLSELGRMVRERADLRTLHWGLKDHQTGQFIGLIDWFRLLEYTQDLQIEPFSTFPHGSNREQEKHTQGVPWLAVLMDSAASWAIPTLFQRGTGEICFKNMTWHRSVDTTLDQQLAVQLLDYPSYSPESPASLNRFGYRVSCCLGVTQDGKRKVWQLFKFPLRVPLSLISVDGLHPGEARSEETWWMVLAQDITDIQTVIQDLELQNADLNILSQLQDELLAEVSHDLKTPLTAIVGLSTVLKMPQFGQLTERQANYVQLIYQKSRQLMYLVNDLLDLTQISGHRLSLLSERVQVRKLCEQAIRHVNQGLTGVEPVRQATSLPVKLTLDPSLEVLEGDGLRLRQILGHLLFHALRATAERGEVGIEVERWQNWAAFTIWHTGVGIAPNQQHLVFQTLHRHGETGASETYPSGLALILAHRLARLHQGDITFISDEVRGSRFTLLVPDCWTEEAPQFIPTPPDDRIILVIAATAPPMTEFLQSLSQWGYRVIVARSNSEAIAKLQVFQPDLILLQSTLPAGSAWEVLLRLKRTPDLPDVPVVVLGQRLEAAQAIDLGAARFLPISTLEQDPEQIRGMIAELTAVRSPLAPPSALTQPSGETPELGGVITADTNLAEPVFNLTVLHLDLNPPSPDSDALATLIHQVLKGGRVVIVDDLEQANILAQVWQPDVMLYAGHDASFSKALEQLSPEAMVLRLPWIILDAAIAQEVQEALQLNVLADLPHFGSEGSLLPTDAMLTQVFQTALGRLPGRPSSEREPGR